MRAYTDADRPRVLDLLKVHGPLDVARLARLRGVNRTAVREQLLALEREGLLQRTEERRRLGRPRHLWALSEKAEALFPQAYGPLALSVLRQVRAIDGDAKVDELLARRTRELARAYRKRLAGKSGPEKLRELARLRADEGYMARTRGPAIAEHHCPIAAVAREFPQVCAFEKRLFEAVLGAKLDRTDHLASGGRACVYAPRT